MIAVAEGNLARGEKLLGRAASTSDSPLFNYLQAARAAHLQGKDERRDEWLKLAYEQTPEAANAVLLKQAEFQLDREQYEQALATLRRIEENSKDHSHALALLARLYFKLGDWPIDVGLPRREAKIGLGHRGFEVHSDPDMSLQDAAARRDFTMNAMAYDPLADKLEDPCGGQRDLATRCLRHTSPAFVEDPVRVLRVARFAAKLGQKGFCVAHTTHPLMCQVDIAED